MRLSLVLHMPAETSEAELLALVGKLNADPAVHGILVQLPLPKAIRSGRVLEAIAPHKDVDGFNPINVGLAVDGEFGRALIPCTPAGAMILIDKACEALERELDGLEAVVVGRSNIVGKPMAQLLLSRNCTVTIAHSRTRDLPAVARRADVLVAAVGRPEMVRGDWIKPGAIVIDVGVNRVAGQGLDASGKPKTRLVGDVAYAEAAHARGDHAGPRRRRADDDRDADGEYADRGKTGGGHVSASVARGLRRRLQDMIFDPAVLQPPLGGVVAGYGIGLAVAFGDQHIRVRAVLDERLAHRFGAFLRQPGSAPHRRCCRCSPRSRAHARP